MLHAGLALISSICFVFGCMLLGTDMSVVTAVRDNPEMLTKYN